ncbi:MAG TPA: dUTP diphosphatase [Acidimicrobiales bacterium]
MPVIRLVSLDPDLELPSYAHPGDAGADLVATADVKLAPGGGRARIGTGVAIELPEGHCAMVLPRSGLAANHGVTCLNAPGLIDSGYRGEIQVILVNSDPNDAYLVRRGDRIAQLVVLEARQAIFVVGEDLSESARGDGGFGHSGR